MVPQVGQVINNKYRLLRLVGDGGMGSVYEARHEVLGTSVALKFLHAELSKRSGLVQRFLQEARVSAQIQSQHVVRVTDVDQTDNGAFIVMEYIEGRTLQTHYEELYRAGIQLSYPDALEYSMQMLEGVEAAHRTGIVHRDLKPDNVMIASDAKGRPLIKLLDFGIAKLKVSGALEKGLTRPGVIMGTPEYMAPEQAFSADAVDARADIFSLGVIVFEMLGGRRPVGGDDPHQIAGAYLSGQISRLTDLAPDISPDLAAAVHRAMAPSAGDRWQSVTELRDAMEPFALAARVPSMMSSVSLSRASLVGLPSAIAASKRHISISQASAPPSASPVPSEAAGARSVPKTLPPEGPSPDTNPADPPRMSETPSRGPTPLGGFGSFAEAAGQAAAAGLPVSSSVQPDAEPVVPPTRSVMPISSHRVDPASTAVASPLPEAYRPPSVSANGTALHSDLAVSVSPFAMGGPQGVPQPPPAMVSRAAPPPASRAASQRKPGMLSSLPAILLLATAVSAMVVGGVFLAHRQSKTDDHEDPPAVTVPSAVVTADPPPPADVPTPPVGPTVTHPAPPHPTGPLKVPPKGSGTPVSPAPPHSGPQPSNPPQNGPFGPILIIPSTLPFDFPFGPAPSQPPSRPQPGSRPAPPQQPPPTQPRGDNYPMR